MKSTTDRASAYLATIPASVSGQLTGQSWLGETTHVLPVEGATGLIEGLAAMLSLPLRPTLWSHEARRFAGRRGHIKAHLGLT